MAEPHPWNEPSAVAGISAAGAFLAGVLVWLAQRLVGKGNLQTSLNQGFSELMSELRTELSETRLQRDEFKTLLVNERGERAAEREAWRVEREELAGQIRQNHAILDGFRRLLTKHGILELPEAYKPPAALPQVVDATLRQDGVDGED